MICLFTACSSVRYTPLNQDLSQNYNKKGQAIYPEFSVYHQSADSSIIYFLINPNELESKTFGDNRKSISFKVKYAFFNEMDNGVLVDSATMYYYNIDITSKPFAVQRQFTIKSAGYNQGAILINIEDINSPATGQAVVTVDRENINGRQYYKANVGSIVLAGNTYMAGEVEVSNSHVNGELSVNQYNRDFPIAYPPYYFDKPDPFDYKPDSAFKISNHSKIKLNKPGFYHVHHNSNNKEGLTLFKFYSGYPDIVSPNNLLEPLRYITTEKEYNGLKFSKNIKTAIDSFWITIGNDEARTRELIKKFYTRVINANKLFTSYKEGWKTDRGMIYIIYGFPDVVYRTSVTESWVYGVENHFLSINFTFTKVLNPFTDNDFMLNRALMYQQNWYNAIDMWRKGHPYNN